MNTKQTRSCEKKSLSGEDIEELKKVLLVNRKELETFVGAYIPTVLDKKAIEKVLDETIAEMSEEELEGSYKEYCKKQRRKAMKCIVKFKLNKDIDLKDVNVSVKNFSITADGKVYKVGFKESLIRTYKDKPSKGLIYEGIELDPAYPDSAAFEKLLDNITVVNNCEITFSNESVHVVSIYYFSFESEKCWLYSEKETDYVSAHIDKEKSMFVETLYDDAMMQYNNMLTIQNLAAEALELYRNTPKDGRLFIDADTLLKDQLDSENEDENSFTFLFPEIVDVWKKATTFKEMKLVEEMFQLLTGFSFKTYLRKCVAETTRSEDN